MPDQICSEILSVESGGGIERQMGGVTESARLSDTELKEVATFATSKPLLDALGDPTPCHGQVADTEEILSVTIEGQTALQKSIVTCMGEPFDSANGWVNRLRANHFGAR
jgi:hypothetical protein